MSSNELNETTDKLYFLGVIDILTPYNIKKKTEHIIKGFIQDKVCIRFIFKINFFKQENYFL